MKVLLVKTSSIGDLLHVFPALTDAARAIPGLTLDWVVENGLACIPGWHPAVRRTLAVSYRHWRFHPIKGIFGGPLARFRHELRSEAYDRILDAQGLYKSAVISSMAKGERHGFDYGSAREKMASFAYRHRHAIPRNLHAIERQRQLFAEALGYPLPHTPYDYGIDRARLAAGGPGGRYLCFLHGTAWRTKQWPIENWRALAVRVADEGLSVRLPYFGDRDRARAEAIASGLPNAELQATPTLEVAAALVAGAYGCVTVDTGLGHLSAALGVPTVSIYGPSSPGLTGTRGPYQRHLASDLTCAPCRKRSCALTARRDEPAPCMAGQSDSHVWLQLREAMLERV